MVHQRNQAESGVVMGIVVGAVTSLLLSMYILWLVYIQTNSWALVLALFFLTINAELSAIAIKLINKLIVEKKGVVMGGLNTKFLNKFISETGREPTYSKNGVTYHTLRYVNWLEDNTEKLQAENARLKTELADSLPLQKVREAFKYCTEQIEKWEEFNALNCQNCNHTNLCSVFGDAYLWEIKKLEKPDNL